MLLICKLIQNRVHSRQLAFAGACPWRRVKVNPGLLCQRNHHNDANTRTNNDEKPIRDRQRIGLLPDLRTEGHDGAAIDGMLARVTFRESPFGCWLETFVDYAGYLLIFAGMAVGLHGEYGTESVVEGTLLMFGTLLSSALVIRQRKMATDPARPQEYRMRLRRSLEATSGNFFSGLGRLFEPMMRNGAFCYVVLICSALDRVHAFFLSITLGANIAWMILLQLSIFSAAVVWNASVSG